MVQPQIVIWKSFKCWRKQTEYVECVWYVKMYGRNVDLQSKNIIEKMFVSDNERLTSLIYIITAKGKLTTK